MSQDEYNQTYDNGFIAGCDHMQLTIDQHKDAMRSAIAALRMVRLHAAQGQADPRFAKDQCWAIDELLNGVIRRLEEATNDESRERHDTAVFEESYGGSDDE